MNKIELLAPAGNKETFFVALNCGADAIYVGLKSFNARGKVENFSHQELKECISYAHLFNVKVYITLNTLIFDTEYQQVESLVEEAINCGADAFIVQDIGLCVHLKKVFNQIEIHASTQMAINNVKGAIFAQKLGIKRVVLSRETPLSEIKLIKQNTNLELEYFIQGALCVSFSGNCYISGMLFNASGNRGRCLQLCRLPYKLFCNNQQKAKGFLLSAKDICMASKLKQLIDAGVTSFKIEGRARRAGYVAGVVSTYRNILDNNLICTPNHKQVIATSFNRGNFTEGYLNGNSNIIFSEVQGHIGILIGTVTKFTEGKNFNEIYFLCNKNLCSGDGLKFLRNGKEVCSLCAIDILETEGGYKITSNKKVLVGDEVRLIQSTQTEKQLFENRKKIKVNMTLYAFENQPLKLEVKTQNKVTVCVQLQQPLEAAKSLALNKQEAINQLSKLGDTAFELIDFNLHTNNVFVRKQQLNEIRRLAVQELENTMLLNYNAKKPAINKNLVSYKNKPLNSKNKQKIAVIISEQTPVLNYLKYDSVIVYYDDCLNKHLNQLLNTLETHPNVFLYLPPIADDSDIKIILNILKNHPNIGVYSNNLYGLEFNTKVFAGFMHNISSQHTINYLSKYASYMVVSPEIDNQIELAEHNSNCFVYAYGSLPLMTIKHCPLKNNNICQCVNCTFNNNYFYEMDGGQKFEIKRQKLASCQFTLNNAKEINVIDKCNQYNVNMLIDLSQKFKPEILNKI